MQTKKILDWTQGIKQHWHLLQKVLVSNGVLTHLVLAVTPRGGEQWPWRGGCCQGLSRKAPELVLQNSWLCAALQGDTRHGFTTHSWMTEKAKIV